MKGNGKISNCEHPQVYTWKRTPWWTVIRSSSGLLVHSWGTWSRAGWWRESRWGKAAVDTKWAPKHEGSVPRLHHYMLFNSTKVWSSVCWIVICSSLAAARVSADTKWQDQMWEDSTYVYTLPHQKHGHQLQCHVIRCILTSWVMWSGVLISSPHCGFQYGVRLSAMSLRGFTMIFFL